jgi:ribosomal protein L13E
LSKKTAVKSKKIAKTSIKKKEVRKKHKSIVQEPVFKFKGSFPKAHVISRFKSTLKIREGRGFSKLELKEVGLLESQARRKKIRIDTKRRSKHKHNIVALKEWLAKKE